MPVDNELYSRLSGTWWDESGELHIIRTSINPPRFGYIRRILADVLKIDPRGKRVLDVGSGGGLLAEEVARLGCDLSGIDPSEQSVMVAREHARQSGLSIDYRAGAGEQIPFGDATFDIVYCCDVLEHVNDLGKVIAEIGRVLKLGGVFFYDTVNRTMRSKLVMIKLLQEWPSTAILPAKLHDWSMFIKPAELEALVRANGMRVRDRIGIAPGRNPIAMVRILRARAKGRMTFAEAGREMQFRESGDQSSLWMGYAVKESGQ